eukprot:TRINITY_DN27062_c0_g2_i2.p1 TRINITY_DN27062_c0_g2~~TRINITY_DN27062_c0_g2_i2.p1  ORF type:complete len:521 (+),score=33.10 TRINITY_DN27062_c0_g2_i2:234-1565(+)
MQNAMHILAVNYQIQCEYFSERTMTNTLWGLSKAGYVQEEFYLTWIEVAIQRIRLFSPRQICLCMWSLSNKGWSGHKIEEKFFYMVVKVSTIILPQFEMIDISMLLWAISKNSQFIRDPDVVSLFNRTAQIIQKNSQHITCQGITNILWAYGLQRYFYIDRLEEMLESLGGQILLRRDEFAVEQIGNIVWSFMRLNFYCYEIFDPLIQIATQEIWDLQPLALSNLLYSFSWFKCRYGDAKQFSNFFIIASDIYLQCMHMFEPLPLANVVQSYACMIDPKDDELFNACIQVLDQSYEKVLVDFEEFDGYCISLIMWAYGKMRMVTKQLFSQVRDRVFFHHTIFTHANLITILYGTCLAKCFDYQFIKIVLRLILEYQRDLFRNRQIQMLEKCIEILPCGDDELTEISQDCVYKFGLDSKSFKYKSNLNLVQQRMYEQNIDEQNW